MSASFTCDGCGSSVEVPIVLGFVLKKDYCAACEPRVQAFLDAEEDLRKRLHEQFLTDRSYLIAKASEGNFRLPDVADASGT